LAKTKKITNAIPAGGYERRYFESYSPNVGFIREATQEATVSGLNPQMGTINLSYVGIQRAGAQVRRTVKTYNANTRTWTITSPELRPRTVQIDAQGRPIFTQVAGIAATSFEYDARGRLQKAITGSGGSAREYTLTYDSFGFVASVKDAESRTISMTNDAIGRALSMRLPDQRQVEFRYDLNNNVTGIKPPGRDWHGFTYDITDNLAGYQPPTLAGVSNPNTGYAYNLHPKLTGVTRPDGRNVSLGQFPGYVGPMQVQTPLGTYFYNYDAGKPSVAVGPVQNDGTTNCTPDLVNFYDGALLKRTRTFGCKGTGDIEWKYNNFFEPNELKITAGSTPAYITAMAYDRDGMLTAMGDLGLRLRSDNGLLEGSSLGQINDGYLYNAFGEPLTFAQRI
jgi:YD repeat-containing protein